MKIGLFADPHYCTKEVLCNTRRPNLSAEKMKEAVREFKKQDVELIICLGDLTDGDSSMEKNDENLKLASAILTDSGIECYCCMGNHDASIYDKDTFSQITSLALAPKVIVKNNNILILLDANYNKDGTCYEKGKVNWKETILPKQQILELENTLKENPDKNVYIFVHQNLDFAVDSYHIINNAPEVNEIIKKSRNVRAVYQGHYHRGASNIHEEIPYITLKAMCEGTENSFMIIEI